MQCSRLISLSVLVLNIKHSTFVLSELPESFHSNDEARLFDLIKTINN